MTATHVATQAQAAIQLGMNGRFFPANWRPAVEEIAFAEENGFQALQFAMRGDALSPETLGDSFDTTAQRLADAGLIPVMEIVMGVNRSGRNHQGETALDLLRANLPAITALALAAVHWHFVPEHDMSAAEIRRVETALRPDLVAGVALADQHGFRLGIEHNEPELLLFGQAEACAAALDAVPGLHFVWDLNHTVPNVLDDFLALTPRMSLLHISDTPLPDVNYHLPIGLGSVDFAHYFRELQRRGFHGPAILEIGGQPKSGGFGRDTDAALSDSLQQLRCILASE